MYAESIEDFARANGAVYAGGGEHIIQNQSSVPLGKYVSQVEMKDPEARRRLKEMLEFQMQEKKEVALMAKKKKKSLTRPPVRQASLMQS